MDPFVVLGIEAGFALDLAELERRHRELSRALHPDRHAASGARERRLALGHAIEVNEAFRALKDPIRRAEALLAVRGVPSGEGKEPPASPDFLMSVMDKREALAEVRRSKDPAALGRLVSEMQAAHRDTEAALAADFARADVAPAEILKNVGKMRYLRRFLDEASSIEDDLF